MAFRSKSGFDILYKSALLFSLIILVLTSWFAPISGDEYVHVKQAENNLAYLSSFGEDKTALDTPISRLKHYGQSFDTITTFIAQILQIDDLYWFRHIANAVIAWFTILFASLITLQISRDKLAAFITVILFVISLRFMGHAMNNLKDIPFAFAFVFSFYFLFRFLEKLPSISWLDLLMITLGLGFGISIRIGGLLIFAFYVLFTGLYLYSKFTAGEWDVKTVGRLSLVLSGILLGVFAVGYFCSLLIWPWALENPVLNPWISLELMHRYPTTVRQIFEGKLIWSDQFPWYYLFKYLFVSLPIIVLIGLGLGIALFWRLKGNGSVLLSIFMLIALGFPLFYASTSGANVYGGWRQMLFVYPPLVILSAIGLSMFWEIIRLNAIMKYVVLGLAALLLLGPIQYFIRFYPYQYTFFNQIVGGAKGAFGNYELDYYFTSYKRAYDYIDDQKLEKGSIVAANFIIPEYYKEKLYVPRLIDYYDRSKVDWDYAIVCNTFLDPFQLKNGLWPPSNTVYIEEIGGKPILAVLRRESKIDYEGHNDYGGGLYEHAKEKLEAALTKDVNNESVRLALARTYIALQDYADANSILSAFSNIYPSNEWARDLRGEIQMALGNTEKAIMLFEENIAQNHKFYHSYVNLGKAKIVKGREDEAIAHLKTCLQINPFYEPAYQLYGKLLIKRGDVELGKRMLEFSIKGESKYGRK